MRGIIGATRGRDGCVFESGVERVRAIYGLYLELNCVRRLKEEICSLARTTGSDD